MTTCDCVLTCPTHIAAAYSAYAHNALLSENAALRSAVVQAIPTFPATSPMGRRLAAALRRNDVESAADTARAHQGGADQC